MYNKPPRLLAEFFGTFAIVLFGAGGVCARSALPNTLGVLGAALVYGLAYGVMAATMAPISGGHLNPAVTIGYWVTRRIGTFDALAYAVMQLCGSIVGAFLLRYAIPDEIWRVAALGTPDLGSGLTRSPAMLLEGLLTFFVVWVTFATPIKGRSLLTLIITAGATLAYPFTGGAMNPARAFGPALAAHHWTNHGVYWVGPLAGGALAAWIYDACFGRASHRDPDQFDDFSASN